MPVTEWVDVVGHTCQVCKENPATHIYGWLHICCQCHAGPGEGLVTPEEARAEHARFWDSLSYRNAFLVARDRMDLVKAGQIELAREAAAALRAFEDGAGGSRGTSDHREFLAALHALEEAVKGDGG